jgi:hypothetical protein
LFFCIWKCQLQNNMQTQHLVFCCHLLRHYEYLKKRKVRRQWRKSKFTIGTNFFVMAVRVSMTICAVGSCRLIQMTKPSSVCAVLCEVTNKGEYSGDISGSRNISWKHLQCSLQTFEHELCLLTFGSKNATSWTQEKHELFLLET